MSSVCRSSDWRQWQKFLGWFVVETTDSHEEEVHVIGEGSRVLFDSPYYHIVEPENSATSEGWHRELRLLLPEAVSVIKTIRFEYPHQF